MTMTLTMDFPSVDAHRYIPAAPARLIASGGNCRGRSARAGRTPRTHAVREHDVARDPAAGDREDLERVQPVPATGLRPVRGERGLPVGGELPYAPARPAHLEHAAHEQAVVAAPPVPQRHRRHLQDRLIGEKPDERGDVGRLERPHVPPDHRAHPGIVGFGDLARIACLREGSAGPLQGAVDGRDRGPELPGDLGGTELEYLAEHQHGPLPRRQQLHRRHQREPHIRPYLRVVSCIGKRL
jgi:hypothetical protein